MKFEHETLRTSWTLVAKLKNLEDDKSWTEFYDLYCQLIIGVAMRAGLREQEARDVLQETMASVSKHIKEFEADGSRGSFRAWLLKMARWRITDQLRKRLPVREGGRQSQEETATTPTIERAPDTHESDLEGLCDAEWRERLMAHSLKQLQVEIPAAQYQIFHLLEVERKSAAEVATLVGRNRAQVYLIKHRVVHALKKIVRRLEKRLG